MSYTAVIQFGNAWGEYAVCTPNAMESVLVPGGRSDVDGVDFKKFARKPEPFGATCTIFDTSQAGIIARVAAWQAAQGTVATLQLPQGYITNVVLRHVRKLSVIREFAHASNDATHMQMLGLSFIQRKEGS